MTPVAAQLSGRCHRVWPRWGRRPLMIMMMAVGATAAFAENHEPITESEPVIMHATMVSAPNPWAVHIGEQVLTSGGTAMDAAVAVQMVLGFVEAPETGIGGGGFLLYYDAETDTLHTYDGRETAPAGAHPQQFTVFGQPLPRAVALTMGHSVGVPGLVAMLGKAHETHGALPWADLLEPAITLAEIGIPMPDTLAADIERDPSLWAFRDMRQYFVAAARADPPFLQNPALADTLTLLAAEGPDVFYQGAVPAAIIARARQRLQGRSTLTPEDFSAYKARQRDPICMPYHRWTVCGAPPPTSGGLAVLQILGQLEAFNLSDMTPHSPEAIHLIAESSRLALADRFHYVGDPASVAVPVTRLLAPEYLARRGQLINPTWAADGYAPGRFHDNALRDPPPAPAKNVDPEPVTEGTSHFTVVDANGNMAVLTSSIEAPFGSRMMVGGFLLNNQLTDFTFQPDYQGGLHPNAVGPGKRPRSSMSPVMVFDEDGAAVLALGSRGGSRIIGYVAQMLIEVLDWGIPINEAVQSPRFLHTGEALELEAETALTDLQDALADLGHQVSVRALPSGVHGVQRTKAGWAGGADPRRDGVVSGEATFHFSPLWLPMHRNDLTGNDDE